ncbi:MAG: hypothetical protein ACI4EA_05080 [Candidatus Ornithomonoglobus sp.]
MQWLFEQLFKSGNKTVLLFLVILIVIFAYIIRVIFLHRKDIKGLVDKWFEGRMKKQELIELVYKSQKRIDELAENRVRDREQSLAIQKQLTDAIQEISNKLDTIQSDFTDDKIENMRWKILSFASNLINGVIDGKACYKEQFDNILKTYDKYENILKENDMKNGQVEESMKFIKERYHELIEHISEK